MKTVFDKTTRDELINRVNSLNEKSTSLWGKMNVYQMVKHCTLWEEMMQGKRKYKQAFIGRFFGKMALKNVLKNDAPLKRSTPTLPELKITGSGDVAVEKAKWISKIEGYVDFSNDGFVHPFFGRMTKEQIGCVVYKHIDHHLRQFGV